MNRGHYFRLLLMMLVMLPLQTRASSIETLIMPGEVISGHAEYETECNRCHVRFRKTTQTTLCLDCHDEIASDIRQQHGYHGRNPDIAEQACSSCHTDHEGRDADIVRLNPATFDHRNTDFPLRDSHGLQPCSACHQSGEAFRDAAADCYSCHGEDEPHDGRLGKQCADCHGEQRWSAVAYDHDRTDFRLSGKHEEVRCQGCHSGERYEDTATDCASCHGLDDVHRGRNGSDCGSCHSPAGWEESEFDHDRDTDFRLQGRHRDARCESCHTDPLEDRKPADDCYSCHRNDDVHGGRNGRDCGDCHGADAWHESRFDHDRETDFPLRGGHDGVACNACHLGDVHEEELSADCLGCHRDDDVHRGQQGEQCQRCHQEAGWGDQVVFDHDLTSFPLIGLHATAPCEACHLSGRFHDTDSRCSDCHSGDDEHARTLGQACETCHNPNGWPLWTFDHSTRTDFELDGTHSELACADCHRHPADSVMAVPRQCSGCHQRDDRHRGRFGGNCSRCHNTDSFRDVRIP